MSKTTTPAQALAAGFKAASKQGTCLCGCEQATGRGSQFRPGHDARMVSLTVKAAQSEGWSAQQAREAATAIGTRSAPLAAKFTNAHARATGKVAKKPSATKVWAETDALKVGRWTYPAQADQDGNIRRNAKRDGSGSWVAV